MRLSPNSFRIQIFCFFFGKNCLGQYWDNFYEYLNIGKAFLAYELISSVKYLILVCPFLTKLNISHKKNPDYSSTGCC